MSVTGISGNNFFAATTASSIRQKFQQIQQEFQRLGQDLQSGNLSQAQSDFATLQQNLPSQQQSAASTSQVTNPLQQEVARLAQDLKSGNLTAAQSDIATVQQQSVGRTSHHHHHRSGGAQDANSSQISSLFSELGQELQFGNLNGALQAYATLQQEFQQSGGSTGATGSNNNLVRAGNFNVSI
jgi:hypothetical protein